MKTIILSAIFLILFCVGAYAQPGKSDPKPTPAPAASTDISGKWALAADAGGQTVNLNADLKQTGTEFSGIVESDVGGGKIDGGKLDGKKFTAVLHADVQGQQVDFKMEGTLEGDKMTGTLSNANFGNIAFGGSRSK